jgi:hypothetical protein
MELGADAVMGPVHPVLVEALRETEKLTGRKITWVSTTSHLMGQDAMDEQLRILTEAGAPICFFHGQWTDRWPETNGHLEGYDDLTARVREAGMIPATAVHLSPRLALVNAGGYDIAAFATPVNRFGFVMQPDRDTALGHVGAATKPVLAIKSLACGHFEGESLEDSLRWVVAQQGVEAVVLGVLCEEEAEESIPILGDAFATKAAVPDAAAAS